MFLSAGRRFVALHTDTAAVAVQTMMFGAGISSIVALHFAPLANQDAAGLFRFCVATTLARRDFRSLLSGCIYNMYNAIDNASILGLLDTLAHSFIRSERSGKGFFSGKTEGHIFLREIKR